MWLPLIGSLRESRVFRCFCKWKCGVSIALLISRVGVGEVLYLVVSLEQPRNYQQIVS